MEKTRGSILVIIATMLVFTAVLGLPACGKAKPASSITTTSITTASPMMTVTTTTTPPTTASVAPVLSIATNTMITPGTSTTAQTTVASSTPASSTPATSGNDLTILLGKYAAIVYYTCNITTNGTQTIKEWVKPGNPNKFKMESTAAGLTSDITYDGQNYYSYIPSTNIATLSVPVSALFAPGLATSVIQYNPVDIGSKTVNGYSCWGYQYTASGYLFTMWVSTQYGLPVEVVSGTTTIDYSNFDFSALPDSTFQLPAGAIINTI